MLPSEELVSRYKAAAKVCSVVDKRSPVRLIQGHLNTHREPDRVTDEKYPLRWAGRVPKIVEVRWLRSATKSRVSNRDLFNSVS